MKTINSICELEVSQMKTKSWEELEDIYGESTLIKEVHDLYREIDKILILPINHYDKTSTHTIYENTRKAIDAFSKISISFFSIYADKELSYPPKSDVLEYIQSCNIHTNILQDKLFNISYCIQRIENDESMNKANESLKYAKIYFIASCILSIISIIATVFNLTINSLSQ